MISRDDRKYYLDLKENQRGRFLRVSSFGHGNDQQRNICFRSPWLA